MPLAATSEGKAFLSDDDDTLKQGKLVFADNCASCHSSKQPKAAKGSDDYKSEMRDLVLEDDFLENNYLSTDERIPVTELKPMPVAP